VAPGYGGSVISANQLLAYSLASVILIVIPGPGVLFVVGRALAHGRRTAVATAFGHAAGNYVVAACVAVGLGSALERSAQAFTVVKLAGAAYLVWLGVQAIRRRSDLAGAIGTPAPGDDPEAPAAPGAPPVPREDRRAVRDGFVVGVTNPKTFILFGAVLPQFVNRSAGHVPAQMLLLALLSVCIGLLSDCAWGFTASAVRAWFARSPHRFALVGGAGGLAMIAVGVTVAITGRKD
jgi:threonine/homoserine/homoserine lactone efflux protein